MGPTVAFPVGIPFTDQLTLWFALPVTLAENCVLSPARSVMPAGVITTPLEVELDPPTFMLPPQPDHTRMASERTAAPANFETEDLLVPIISDPLS
jgi:hypothetical protein